MSGSSFFSPFLNFVYSLAFLVNFFNVTSLCNMIALKVIASHPLHTGARLEQEVVRLCTLHMRVCELGSEFVVAGLHLAVAGLHLAVAGLHLVVAEVENGIVL